MCSLIARHFRSCFAFDALNDFKESEQKNKTECVCSNQMKKKALRVEFKISC